MHYTRSEISELALGQLTSEKLIQAVDAFNGFAELFGKPWLDKKFQGVRSTALVMYVLSLWEDWSLVKGLTRSEKVQKRWRKGIDEEGVQAELRVVAYLVSMHAEVDLFPQVSNRFCDFRYRADSRWIYGEVSRRGISKVRRKRTEILHQLALAAARAVKGKHGKVAILRDLDDDEIRHIISWLGSFDDREEARLNDLVVFRAGSIDSTMDQDESLIQLVPKPRLFATYLSRPNDHTFLKGTACICVSDQSAQEILKDEAAQLPRDHPGVVILDLSSVIGGHTEWSPLIQRRLQPTINTRISGVLLFQIALNSTGPTTQGCFLINQYARNPLPAQAIALFQGVVRSEINEARS
jgi:hypothetical protein